MNNPDHISESVETTFWVKILKFFDADPESFCPCIWDPGSKLVLFTWDLLFGVKWMSI
jgi:hypothetical protein